MLDVNSGVNFEVVESLIREGVKKGTAFVIAKHFPELKTLKDIKIFISDASNKRKFQTHIRGRAVQYLNELFKLNYGRKLLSMSPPLTKEERLLTIFAGLSGKLSIGKQVPELEILQRLENQRKNLLANNLAFYGVEGAELGKLVDSFPWLQDFFSFFLMASSRIGAQMVCSVLTPEGVERLNELFFKEYNRKPLPVS